MSLTISYAPDGSSGWTSAIVLCNTTRSITELNVKFNHKRVITVSQLAASLGSGAAALAQDLSNQRNTLSLRVRRSVDMEATPVAFPDPEGALAFALQQPAQFATTGALRIQLVGSGGTNTTLYMLNAGIEVIDMKYEDLGVAPAFDYTFNGGLITTTSPY
jgi:hypothetical protein